ncbi:MAG: glycosyltransferase family 39 protein [Nitrospira sp.]|nr:glycosyltransferase family 39 protein [Nitrospira sp.]
MIFHKLIESASFLLMSLPIIAFVCLWCVTTFLDKEDWRLGLLKAAVLWGSFTLLTTELLSIFLAIRPATLALAWILVIVSSLYVMRHHIAGLREDPLLVAVRPFALPAGDRWWTLPLIPVAVIVIATGVIALVAPPNNWDSMTYHMSRVEHWRANGSVIHYPTNVVWQIYLNPWAEFAILQFQTLGFGSDRLANLVQWFSFVGVLVGVSLLVRLLGGALFAQSLAALVVASTPMVVLQSTSTQNDVVCGFFVVATVYFAFERVTTSSKRHEWYLPLSLGLAFATKGTAYLILLPFVGYVMISVMKQESIRSGLRLTGMVVLASLLLNIGHWARNFGLWHHPLGDPQWLRQYQNESFGVPETLSNVVRNVALHLGTPSSKVNAFTEGIVQKIHEVLGIGINEPSLTFALRDNIVPEAWFLTHEDYAGNGVLLVLSCMAVGFAILAQAGRGIRPFALLLCASSLLFCIFLKWAPFNSRLHTPLFFLAAVLVGWMLAPRQFEVPNTNRVRWQQAAAVTGMSLIAGGVFMNEWVIAWLFAPHGIIHSQPLQLGIWFLDLSAIGCGLLMLFRPRWYLRTVSVLVVLIFTLGALPWVTMNQLRPLISTQYAPSIFERSRIEQMFANNSGLITPYTELIFVLAQLTSCREIGLKIQVGAFEYPLWQIARHSGMNVAFHHVAIDNESAKTVGNPTREPPCALIVIGDERSWDPDLSGLGHMPTAWSQAGIRLLVPVAKS